MSEQMRKAIEYMRGVATFLLEDDKSEPRKN